jgi:hypothetical protein
MKVGLEERKQLVEIFLKCEEEDEAYEELRAIRKQVRGATKLKVDFIAQLVAVKEYKRAIKVLEGV